MVPLWAPLSVLLIAAVILLVLCYRRHSRISRNEANLRISRDRANFSAPSKRSAQPESASAPRAKRAFTSDLPPTLLPLGAPSGAASGSSIAPPPGLQRLSHQVRKIRVPTELDDLASLPDKRSTAASLPPGPPSSSTGQSVAEQEVTRSGAADNGVAPTAPAPPGEQIILRPTARVLPWVFPGWSGTAGLASAPKKKRPAPAEPDPSAPRTKKEPFTSPCN